MYIHTDMHNGITFYINLIYMCIAFVLLEMQIHANTYDVYPHPQTNIPITYVVCRRHTVGFGDTAHKQVLASRCPLKM